MKQKKAFTLLEVLIVIAVIGILATVSITWYLGAQARARDLHRVNIASDIKQALELYYDQYKAYPASSGASCTAGTLAGFTGNWCSSAGITEGSGARWIGSDTRFAPFLATEPIDPRPAVAAEFGKPGTFYYFRPNTATNWYMLVFALEDRANYSGEDGVRPNASKGVFVTPTSTVDQTSLCCQVTDNTRLYRFSEDPAYSNVVTFGNNHGSVSACNNPKDNPVDMSASENTCAAPI